MNLRVGKVFAALALALPHGLFAVGGTITNGDITFVRSGYGTNPTASFFAGAGSTTDFLFEMGWWIRVDDETQELPFFLPTVEQFSGASSTVTWPSVAGTGAISAVEATQIYDLSGFRPDSGYFAISLTLQNESQSPISVHLFHYADLDVGGSSGNDAANVVETTPNVVIDVLDGANVAEHTGAVESFFDTDQVRHQISAFSEGLRGSLNDSAVTTLNNSLTPFGPGDVTSALQFDFELAPEGSAGDSVDVVVVMSIQIHLHCGVPQGIFCDSFESGGSLLWINP